ncbi:MAG TPA: hypothetical protein VKQ71_17600 [Acidimicrobiales bacterium]|nr:hypothetical protein [Acidimicrobiales bacterium]
MNAGNERGAVDLRRLRLIDEKRAALETARQAVADAGDPCFECECCRRFALALELVKASAELHLAGELRVAACHPSCLICSSTSWQSSS